MGFGKSTGSAFGSSFEESPPTSFPSSSRRRSPSPESRYSYSYASEHFHRSSRFRSSATVNNDGETSSSGKCDSENFAFFLIAVSVLVAVFVIFSIYSSETLQLGPNSSMLIKPNHLLVDSIKVEELDSAEGAMLYGFYEKPPLDLVVNWSETHNVTLPGSTHKEWIYHLNKGSQINVSYSVNSPSSSSLILVILRGKDGLTSWLEDPSDPTKSFSWHNIRGNGSIQVDASTATAYYVAVGNLNSKVVEVQLDTKINTFLYNTAEPYYKCSPLDGEPCGFQLSFPGGNAAVLSTPGRKSGNGDGYWNVKLSYGPRWITFLVGVGGMTIFALLVYYMESEVNPLRRSSRQESAGNPSPCGRQERRRDQLGGMESERNPLLPGQENDLFRRGSSYAPSAPPKEDEYVEDELASVVHEGQPVADEENSNRNDCAICFDARKDCFFIPYGHCAACFGCATSVAETSGACPICRRRITKVEKIYNV